MRNLIFPIAIVLLFTSTSAAQNFHQGDAATYKFYQGGNEIGIGTYEITKVSDFGIEIKGTYKASSRGGETNLELTTVLTSCGDLRSYQLIGTMPCRTSGAVEPHEFTVNVNEGKADTKIRIGNDLKENVIDVPKKCMVMFPSDVFCYVHLAGSPPTDSEPKSGSLIIPTFAGVIDYSLESAGDTKRNVSGKELECKLYSLKIMGGQMEFPLFVVDGKLIAVGTENADFKIEIVM
jgi:hypothetical protein